jgi:phytoene synthase
LQTNARRTTDDDARNASSLRAVPATAPIVIAPRRQVLEGAKEVPLALMRLRWWRDTAAAALAGSPPAHPVARALAATRPANAASASAVSSALERLVLCRESDAALAGLPPSLEALEVYAAGTQGSLLRALLHASGAHTRAGDVAAGALGAAVGLTAVLAGARAHLSRGRVYLPADALRKEGVTPEALRFEGGGAGARQVVRAVADAARAQLAMARAVRDALEPAARRTLLPAVPTGLWLDALHAAGHDAFADALACRGGVVSPLGLQLRVAWANARGRY